MTHDEIEEILGAYALDSAEPAEIREIDAHLLECPRCRAEVEAYRVTASALATVHAEAPTGLWDKIADSIAEIRPSGARSQLPPGLRAAISSNGIAISPRPIRRVWAATFTLVGMAAAAAIVVLAVEVASLHSQTQRLDSAVAQAGLSAAVAQATIAPHATVELVARDHSKSATIIILPTGDAYWISSSLPRLPAARTYQIWGVSNGRVVSIGLLGTNPHVLASFRVEPSISRVLVNEEPEGGTVQPTTPVLAQAVVRST